MKFAKFTLTLACFTATFAPGVASADVSDSGTDPTRQQNSQVRPTSGCIDCW